MKREKRRERRAEETESQSTDRSKMLGYVPGSSDWVIIACNIPNKVRLHLCRPIMRVHGTASGGTVTVKEFDMIPEEEGGVIWLDGPRIFRGKDLADKGDHQFRENGYGFTKVKRAWWEQWYPANQDNPFLANRCIFATTDVASIKTRTREQADEGVLSGFEPLDPSFMVDIRGK